MKIKILSMLAVFGILLAASPLSAETIGSVITQKNFVGANATIQVEAFDDPQIKNVVCYLSYPQTGGLAASVGLAENKSNGSIACRSTGPIDLAQVQQVATHPVEVFRHSSNIFFKAMRVMRFWDTKRNVLVYLTYSKKLFDGSPKNSVSVVVIPRQ